MSFERLLSLRKTLAFRLTLWYAGIFTLSSFVAFVLFYTVVLSVIQGRTDQELLGQARQFSTVLATQGLGAVEAFAVLEAQGAGEKKVFFRLLYPTGQAFSSSNMSYWQDIKVRETALAQALGGDAGVFETLVLQKRRDKVRILYALIAPQVILQVGQSMEASSRFLEAFRWIFGYHGAFDRSGCRVVMVRRAVSAEAEAVTRTAQIISGETWEKGSRESQGR
jgi:hypothetical protein